MSKCTVCGEETIEGRTIHERCVCKSPLAAAAGPVESAIAEYLDWLTNQEIACEQVCMYHAANAYALASSKLGTLLIDCKFYQPATPNSVLGQTEGKEHNGRKRK